MDLTRQQHYFATPRMPHYALHPVCVTDAQNRPESCRDMFKTAFTDSGLSGFLF